MKTSSLHFCSPTKKAAEAAFLFKTWNQTARQEPGRYFAKMALVPAALPGPQSQLLTLVPHAGVVQVANVSWVAALQGAIRRLFVELVTCPPTAGATSTITRPAVAPIVVRTPGVVVIDVTNLVAPDAPDTSQPHSLTALPLVLVWITSVMVVRQDDAAKIASDTRARTV